MPLSTRSETVEVVLLGEHARLLVVEHVEAGPPCILIRHCGFSSNRQVGGVTCYAVLLALLLGTTSSIQCANLVKFSTV